ncbi:hypothetical protein [Microbispora sp. H10836]|uniref:hypothetical protein n=1 Tax=Microbispora sp. H10836 TaxID=2729106 RepID=UPI0014764D21|nr:hypothetical protein [Microbispora sp. H10836]
MPACAGATAARAGAGAARGATTRDLAWLTAVVPVSVARAGPYQATNNEDSRALRTTMVKAPRVIAPMVGSEQ